MFTEDMPKRISRLFALLESLETALGERFAAQPHSRQGERCLIVQDSDGSNLLYLGIRYDLWMIHQHLLWFGVHTQWSPEIVTAFSGMHSGRFLEYMHYRLCHVDETLLDPQEFTGFVKQQLDRLCRGWR